MNCAEFLATFFEIGGKARRILLCPDDDKTAEQRFLDYKSRAQRRKTRKQHKASAPWTRARVGQSQTERERERKPPPPHE